MQRAVKRRILVLTLSTGIIITHLKRETDVDKEISHSLTNVERRYTFEFLSQERVMSAVRHAKFDE